MTVPVGDPGDSARVAPDADPLLRRFLDEAAARLGGEGLRLYEGSYVDLAVAGECEAGPFALVAGTHTANFPYFGTEPWDQCLLLVGDEGFAFTGRVTGEALHIDFDREAETATGVIRFAGDMRRARDGARVSVELDLPIALRRFPNRLLAEAYNFLQVDGLVGMRWNPWDLRCERGRVRVGATDHRVSSVRGSCERGVLINLRAHDFAFKYDYHALSKPASTTDGGEGGYGVIHFVTRALHDSTLLDKAIDLYVRNSAAAIVTVGGGRLEEGNPHSVELTPAPADASPDAALLFEDVVDLGPALLHRQMVRSRDASGATLHGLREIFIAKPERPPSRLGLILVFGALVIAALSIALLR